MINYRDSGTGLPYMNDVAFLEGANNLVTEYGTGIKIEKFGSEGKRGPSQNQKRKIRESTALNSISAGRRSALQGWLGDRREAFDALVETYSGEELAAREAASNDETIFYQSRATSAGGQRELPLGRDGDGAAVLPTDPEGRELAAKFIAGVRNPGGPNVALTDEELVTVAFAIADKVSVTSKLPDTVRGASQLSFSGATGDQFLARQLIAASRGLLDGVK